MNSNEIYQKISENIIYQLNSFKKGELKAKEMNENLILNLSSMCKFLKDKETMNNTTFDVFVPVSRLEYAVNSKIRGSTGDESKIEEKKENMFHRNGTLDLETESFFGAGEQNNFNLKQNTFIDEESIMSQSLFSRKKDSIGNNQELISNFGDILDQS